MIEVWLLSVSPSRILDEGIPPLLVQGKSLSESSTNFNGVGLALLLRERCGMVFSTLKIVLLKAL